MSKQTNRRGRRHDKKGRSKGEGQYAKAAYSMLQSDAYRLLSGTALKVYWELRTRYHGSNNGRLRLSHQEAADLLGMSKSTVGRALVELELKGFVIKTRQGLFHKHMCSEYRVTELGSDGAPPSNNWRNWRRPKPCRKKADHRPPPDPIGAPSDPPEYRGP